MGRYFDFLTKSCKKKIHLIIKNVVYKASTDISFYKAPDCSARTCPSGRAWADVPSSSTVAHAFAECSNRGTCNRGTGLCTCFDGFVGSACQRNSCPNDCSGHGICLSIKQLARMSNALPLGKRLIDQILLI